MAVVIGEAAVRIRADADEGEIRSEIEPKVEGALEKAGESGADAFSEKMALGVAAAGALVAEGFAASLEQAALGDKLAAQLGASGQYADDLGSIAGDLYANAYGDSLETVNDALRGVIQSGAVMEDASNEQLESVTGSVLNLAEAMDQDVGGTSRAVGRMIQTGLAANAEQALDILTRGFQQGADAGGDLLDVVGEYGTTFSELGLSGGQAMGLLNQALAAGIPNADFASDALREMGIIGREGGDAAAAAVQSLGLSSKDYFAAMQAGGPRASAALDQVLDALRNTKDPAERAAAATALVGTQYEDLGDAILQLDPSEAEKSLGTIEGAAGRMGDTLNDNASTNLTAFWRSAQQAFVDVIGGQVVPIVENVVLQLRDHLGPALDAVGGFITNNVVPPLQTLAGWLGEHETLTTVLAYVVGTVLVAALAVWGTRSLIEAGKSIVAWVTTAASSTVSAEAQQKSALQVVAGWVMMGARAVLQGIKIAAVWTAQVVASAVSGAASFAVQVARVVAGWVVMGTQSLLQAARMAAAWVLAMGPIGWIIVAVVALVALIVANWDTVKRVTVEVFTAIWEWIQGAWEWIKGAVSAGLQAIVDWFMNWTILGIVISHWDQIIAFISDAWTAITDAVSAGIGAVVDFFVALPGRIWGVLSGLASFLGGIFATAFQWVVGAVVTGTQWVIDLALGLPGRLWGALQGIGRLLADIFGGAWRWASDTIVGAVDWIIGFIGGIPGRIWSLLSGVGTLLVGLGGDLIRGLINGISAAAGFVGDVGRNIVNSIIGFVNSQVIDRINGLLEFSIAGVTINPPDIPRIPRLHEGGYFDSGSAAGEGLALLRDHELVATPEQQSVANDLLRGLLAGRLDARPGTTAPGGSTHVQITENVYAAPGQSVEAIAAAATQGVVWNLNVGITNPAPLPAGATT